MLNKSKRRFRHRTGLEGQGCSSSPAPLTLLTFEQHILREAPLWSRVWLGMKLGQEAGAVMPGRVVGEVSNNEAVSEGKLFCRGHSGLCSHKTPVVPAVNWGKGLQHISETGQEELPGWYLWNSFKGPKKDLYASHTMDPSFFCHQLSGTILAIPPHSEPY